MLKRFAAVALICIAAVPARADINDRINACQAQGGGTCVFDILRELAAGGSSGGRTYCACESNSSHCISPQNDINYCQQLVLKRASDGTTVTALISSIGYDGQINPVDNCTAKMSQLPVCR